MKTHTLRASLLVFIAVLLMPVAHAQVPGPAKGAAPWPPAPDAPAPVPGRIGPGWGPGVAGPGAMPPGMMAPPMAPMHHGMGRMGPMGPGARAEHLADLLGLNDEQHAQVERIMEDTRRANWGLIGQLMSERFALRSLLRADKLQPDAVVEQTKRIDDMSRQLLKARLEARNKIVAVLNPEQQQMFRAMPIGGMR